MYQLIFRHLGSDEVEGAVQLCIEQNYGAAKKLVNTWMHSYIEYVDKCNKNNIDDNENLTVEEKFFNEYTYGGEDDIAEIVIYKLKTMADLNDIFDKYNKQEEYEALQNALFDPIYKLCYSRELGMVEVDENNNLITGNNE